MSIIYHIAEANIWQQAQTSGSYQVESLRAQGFIHLSEAQQVLLVANAIYRGQRGLVLLHVETTRLTAELRREPPDHPDHPSDDGQQRASAELFPHLYGSLNLDAVIKVTPFEPNADGEFTALV